MRFATTIIATLTFPLSAAWAQTCPYDAVINGDHTVFTRDHRVVFSGMRLWTIACGADWLRMVPIDPAGAPSSIEFSIREGVCLIPSLPVSRQTWPTPSPDMPVVDSELQRKWEEVQNLARRVTLASCAGTSTEAQSAAAAAEKKLLEEILERRAQSEAHYAAWRSRRSLIRFERIGALGKITDPQLDFDGQDVLWSGERLCVAQGHASQTLRCYSTSMQKWGERIPRGSVVPDPPVGPAEFGISFHRTIFDGCDMEQAAVTGEGSRWRSSDVGLPLSGGCPHIVWSANRKLAAVITGVFDGEEVCGEADCHRLLTGYALDLYESRLIEPPR